MCSILYPIIQCCRKGLIQRFAWKVHEIIGYVDKYVIVLQVHDDNGVRLLRGFMHIRKLWDEKMII
jgi:hypothetical protein